MNVKITLKGDYLKIYLDDTLHLYINHNIIGFQAWNRENRWWEIEYYTKHKTILTQYDCSNKWKAILKELDKTFH